MKLRVGVVGLGQAWETRHAPALRALADRFEVRAFCDPVAHRASEVAQRWPARMCDGFRALAASADIDAVLLLSARWYGALPILAACDAGKAIYCSAALDVASALAEWAEETQSVRPEIDETTALLTEAARHPVVEEGVRREGLGFTPNDARLDASELEQVEQPVLDEDPVMGPGRVGIERAEGDDPHARTFSASAS